MEQQDFSAIPAELRERAQWVIWRLEQRRDRKTGKTSLTKEPYQARYPQKHAATNDPRTWASFALAVKALQAGRAEGIGFVFNKDYAGIDLDHCIDEQGQMAAWARARVDGLASYAELSPSERGVHINCKAELPGGGIKRPDIEMYDQGRFFTFTGKKLECAPAIIESRQEEVTALYVAITTRPERPQKAPPEQEQGTPLDVADNDMLALALRNSKFASLWDGNTSEYGNNASAADCALCCHLAWWTGKDKARIDRLFRDSALLRDKWDEKHSRGLGGAGVPPG